MAFVHDHDEAPCLTLQRAVAADGTGLYSGRPARASIHPGPVGAGIRIGRGEHAVPLHPDLAHTPGGHTCAPGAATVEHLLAALVGLGITDVDLEISGGEVPALDGAAAAWVALLKPATTDAPARHGPRPPHPVAVAAEGGEATWQPADGLHVDVEIDWPGGPSGRFAAQIHPTSFAQELAPARTFARAADVAALRAAGRGAGATPDTVVLWPGSRLRFPDEPVRHKALDLLGDLAWLGGPPTGRFTVRRGTHALHLALVRAILAASRPGAPPFSPA